MKDKYTPGQDCMYHAYSESECGCGADWTSSEVYELREKLAAERDLADRLAEALNKAIEIIPDDAYVAERIEVRRWEKAIAAWKEARSE